MAQQIALIKDALTGYFTNVTRFMWNVRVNQQKHDRIWDAFFPDKRWLYGASEMGLLPALVGEGVRQLYNGSHGPAYLVLVTGDHSRKFQDQRKLLLECLKIDNNKRRWNRITHELVLKEFNIILNVEDAFLGRENISLDPQRLFSEHDNVISSAALFWRDHNLRTISSDAIVGIRGEASSLESVASWCSIELTHPKAIGGERWNQVFNNPDEPLDVKTVGGTANFVEGWELAS